MNERMKQRAGILVAAVFVADGLAHLYWATGSTWPAPDPKTLSGRAQYQRLIWSAGDHSTSLPAF